MIELFNGLPLFEACINENDETGMTCISIVSDPAISKNFIAFENKKSLSFSIQDEEKRLILGPVMIANLPIYRRNEEMGEYYIMYSEETIRQMAQKYLTEGYQNKVSVQHNGILLDGIEMTQWFIKNTTLGISPSFFDDVPDGSLFGEFHISDDDTWNLIKTGEAVGFSLEGLFDIKPKMEEFSKIEEPDYEKECRALLNKLINKLN